MNTGVILALCIVKVLAKSHEYSDVLRIPKCPTGHYEIWVKDIFYCCDPSKGQDKDGLGRKCELGWLDNYRTTSAAYIILPDTTKNIYCYWYREYGTKKKCPNGEKVIAKSDLRENHGEQAFCCKIENFRFSLLVLSEMNCHWNPGETDRFFKCKAGFTDWFRLVTRKVKTIDTTRDFGGRLQFNGGLRITRIKNIYDILCCKFMLKRKFEAEDFQEQLFIKKDLSLNQSKRGKSSDSETRDKHNSTPNALSNSYVSTTEQTERLNASIIKDFIKHMPALLPGPQIPFRESPCDVQPVEECSPNKGEVRQWIGWYMFCCDPTKKPNSKDVQECELRKKSDPPFTLIELRISAYKAYKGQCYWNMTDDPDYGRDCPDEEFAIAWRIWKDFDDTEKRFCCRFNNVKTFNYLSALEKLNCHWMPPSTDQYVKCTPGFTDYFRFSHFPDDPKSAEWMTDLLCCKFMGKIKPEARSQAQQSWTDKRSEDTNSFNYCV